MPYRTLISTETLASHIREAWVIVDCRYDLQNESWGLEQYQAAHIPGAAYVSLNEHLSAPRTGSNGRHPLPSVDTLAATFGRLGISPDIQVVVYDQDSGMYASRLWWSLRYLGHDTVALLDGGWAKWIRERRPTASGDEQRRPVTFNAKPRREMQVGVDDVERHVGNAAVLLVDARAPERFEGRTEPIDRMPGHIPGAVNHFFKTNLAEDGTMLAPDRLRHAFDDVLRGHTPSETVMYCGSGVTACHNLLAMEHAGLPGARLYVGSWSEWSADPSRPKEKGPSTR
ncbi:MAG TPA: sulfurtransferase [Vicinamibacterales bacterium]|nr:sulfurtransferase [Vicinamibacterales bacterium]